MDTIIYNGNIYLGDGNYVQAVAIKGGVVAAVGKSDDILPLATDITRVIDAKGNAVVPGFNDSHMHLHGVGQNIRSVQLGGAKSVDDIVRIGADFLKKHSVPEGTFITGRGWNQDYFVGDNTMPTAKDLDKISTSHPILFKRACGHLAVCNSKAMELCGVTSATPQIEGSEFYYFEDGTPNGIFTEAAIDLIEAHVPTPTVAERVETLNAAMDYALSQGITSVQTNDIIDDNFADMYEAYSLVYKASKARPRSYHQCCFSTPELYQKFIDAGFRAGVGDDYNKIGPLKLFVDGSLGARTALMNAPYADDNSTTGIACMTQAQLDEMVKMAVTHDTHVAVHAIGDLAIDMVLDSCLKNSAEKNGEKNPLRHGIVHCQITGRRILDRIAEQDLLVLAQPIFIHYDLHVVAQRVGEQLASTSYAFGELHRNGVHVSFGTDSPVEDLKTMDNIHCAVTRRDLSGNPPEGYCPEQAVSVETAIDLYTAESAYCSFEEDIKGKLAVGYYADLAILDSDIFSADVNKIRDIKVTLTMVGGEVAYTAE